MVGFSQNSSCSVKLYHVGVKTTFWECICPPWDTSEERISFQLIISGGSHQYESLEQTRANYESSVGDLLEKLSQKITELCNLEKSTWLTVDLLTENCEKMLTQVDEYANEKVWDGLLLLHAYLSIIFTWYLLCVWCFLDHTTVSVGGTGLLCRNGPGTMEIWSLNPISPS